MNNIKTKVRRIKYDLKHNFFTVENIVLTIAIVLCLLWTLQSIGAMTRNWELAERLGNEKRALEILKIEVEMAELENEYYKSNEYQDLVARRQLDKKLEGENMVVMPDNSEWAKNKYKANSSDVNRKEYHNFEKWLMYLFPNY